MHNSFSCDCTFLVQSQPHAVLLVFASLPAPPTPPKKTPTNPPHKHTNKKTSATRIPSADGSWEQDFGSVANMMILKGSLRRWLPCRLSEVMLFLSSVNWHFPFKTASLCEWAVWGCGLPLFFFLSNQPSPSLWHHSPVTSWRRNLT